MTLVLMPDAPVPAAIAWSIRKPAQVNRSEFTSKRRVTILPEAPRITAKVTLPPILGEARVRRWRAWLAQLEGVANRFRLIACEGPQHAHAQAVTVDGAGQIGRSIVTKGWQPNTGLPGGAFVTIAEQLLMLPFDVMADADGRATIKVDRDIWEPTIAGGAIETLRPFAVMSMSDDDYGWSVGIGQNYAIAFDCEEAR